MTPRASTAARRARVQAEGQAVRTATAFLGALQSQMEAAGVSHAELARRLDVSPSYVSKVMRGPANLSLATLSKLAHAVGCALELRLAVTAQQ